MKRILQQGFSIIELMVALVLGAVLLLGVTQVMVSSSLLGNTSKNLLVNQSTAKAVFDALSGVRRAGFRGCQENGLIIPKAYLRDVDALMWSRFDRMLGFAALPYIDPNDNNTIGVVVHYGAVSGDRSDTDKAELPDRDCLNNKLYFHEFIYKNCADKDGDAICVIGSSNIDNIFAEWVDNAGYTNLESGKGVFKDYSVTKIRNARIDRVTFNTLRNMGDKSDDNDYRFSNVDLIAGEVRTFPKDPDSLANQFGASQSITFYITVTTNEPKGAKDSMVSIEKKYSATFAIRNLHDFPYW